MTVQIKTTRTLILACDVRRECDGALDGASYEGDDRYEKAELAGWKIDRVERNVGPVIVTCPNCRERNL